MGTITSEKAEVTFEACGHTLTIMAGSQAGELCPPCFADHCRKFGEILGLPDHAEFVVATELRLRGLSADRGNDPDVRARGLNHQSAHEKKAKS